MNKAKEIDFKYIKSSVSGKISVIDGFHDFPFEIKRIFWIYEVANNTIRGNHAHYNGVQVLVCLSGALKVKTTYLNGESECFTLKRANKGLLIPAMVWHEMEFEENTTVQVFASTLYKEKDYIRDFNQYKLLLKP